MWSRRGIAMFCCGLLCSLVSTPRIVAGSRIHFPGGTNYKDTALANAERRRSLPMIGSRVPPQHYESRLTEKCKDFLHTLLGEVLYTDRADESMSKMAQTTPVYASLVNYAAGDAENFCMKFQSFLLEPYHRHKKTTHMSNLAKFFRQSRSSSPWPDHGADVDNNSVAMTVRKRRWGDTIGACIQSNCGMYSGADRLGCIVLRCQKKRGA